MLAMPSFMLDLGAKIGDLANTLGWMPPMRSTAIAELRRGVSGDPSAWIAATGIAPKTLTETIGRHPATIQDKWFARLFLIKALIVASLVGSGWSPASSRCSCPTAPPPASCPRTISRPRWSIPSPSAPA